jgi:hypothetical protein
MDWTKIEKDFKEENKKCFKNKASMDFVFNWVKKRINHAKLPIESPEKLTEEEKNEFYITNLTADIKANYGK